MKTNHLIHKIFLITMFCFCAVAVVYFVDQRIDIVSAEGTAFLGKTVSSQYIETTPTTPTTANIATNVASRVNPIVKPEDVYINTFNTPSTVSGTAQTVPPIVKSPIDNNQEALAPRVAPDVVVSSTTKESVAPVVDSTQDSDASAITIISDNKNSQQISRDVNTTEKQVVNNDTDSFSQASGANIVENPIAKDQKVTEENVMRVVEIEKLFIPSEPIVIEAKNLLQNNNPKIVGTINEKLKVETVALDKKEDGKNRIKFTGKAEPNSFVTIYIFSDDPVVITVKADENGNWNYELEKELADGQHEAYVAVTDTAGKIISKSEPIAFVKTAQAATVIPISALNNNESPVKKASQQYILIAIIIMSVCLAIALALIGFLTHKRNLDEGIN